MSIQTRPEYVERAFRNVYYGGQYEKAINAFIQRWGGADINAFFQALAAGTSEEKAVALFALGYSNTPGAQAALLERLQSSEPHERWARALSLGEMKDERALPALISMLDEFLPPRMHPLEREGGLFHFWRIKTAAVLGAWGKSDLAPVLRLALEKAWELEQVDQIDSRHVWHAYQDELVYALGRLAAFGALSGLSLPASRLRLWEVLFACGSLQARSRYGDLLTQVQINQTLKDEVAEVLTRSFALTVEERVACIEQFADLCFERMAWK